MQCMFISLSMAPSWLPMVCHRLRTFSTWLRCSLQYGNAPSVAIVDRQRWLALNPCPILYARTDKSDCFQLIMMTRTSGQQRTLSLRIQHYEIPCLSNPCLERWIL